MLRRSKKQKLEKKTKEDEDARSSDAESPLVYLVVGHGVTRPSYSVFKVNPTLPADADADADGDTPVPLPPYLAHLTGKHCMSFIPVRSRRHGPWIVGVGGSSARNYAPETIVFDTEMGKEILGPKLLSTKLCPIVLPFGDKIYALARKPAVTGNVNFVPWFEVLDLSMARVDDASDCLVDCEWKALPRPPFFPWDLTPTDYIFPPVVAVNSHVAVASYILLSITGQTGTHMFDVEKEEWGKLDDKDLPFRGPAVPLQGTGTLYLGLSNTTNEITAYRIKVVSASAEARPRITPGCLSLSIVEIQMVTNFEDEEIVSTGGRLISLDYLPDRPGFCSFTWSNDDPLQFSSFPEHTKELLTIRAYTIEGPLSQDYFESTRTLVISNQWKQVYSICDTVRRLSFPCLAGAISL